MLKITPKDKRLLKSSKVRAYMRKVEKIMDPAAKEVQQATMDAVIFGTGAVKMTPDGQVKRVDPQVFFTEARPVTEKDWQTAKKHAFSALQQVMAGCKDRVAADRASWDILARAVADYVATVKVQGPWIMVRKVANCKHPTMWQYAMKRRNGKGVLRSCWYRKRGECVRMAQKTAKILGIEYRERKA